MFETISSKLSEISKNLKGHAKLSEKNISDTIRKIRIALLEADVSITVVKKFISNIREDVIGKKVLESLTPGQMLVSLVNEELIKLFGKSEKLNLVTKKPVFIMFSGLQGVGKTTSVAKIAFWIKEHFIKEKYKILIASCDFDRPAAQEQLKILSDQLVIDFYDKHEKSSPLIHCENIINFSKKQFYDVVLLDTAGRLSLDQKMMNELKEIHKKINPAESLYVVDAMQGQDALKVIKKFSEEIQISGIFMTKLDGDSRGGSALSIKSETDIQIKFVGTGEKISDVDLFYPDRMASRILGMGDVLSIVEDVKLKLNDDENKKIVNKIKKGVRFNLNDFKQQLIQMNKLGGANSLLDKLPSNFKVKGKNLDNSNKIIKKNISIINSMTMEEKLNPNILKFSTKKRISKGSGCSLQDINVLIKQFQDAQKMIKLMRNNKSFINKFL